MIYTVNKTSPHIFHCAQAAPTRYKDRSQWLYDSDARVFEVGVVEADEQTRRLGRLIFASFIL